MEFEEYLKDTYQIFMVIIGIIIISVILTKFFNIHIFIYTYEFIKNYMIGFFILLFLTFIFIFKLENYIISFIINLIFLLFILPFITQLISPFFSKIPNIFFKNSATILFDLVVIYIAVLIFTAIIYISKKTEYYEFNWFHKIFLAILIYSQLLLFLFFNKWLVFAVWPFL